MYNPNWSSSNGNDDNNYWCAAGINAAAAAAANCVEAAAFYAGCHRLPTTAAAAAAVAAAKFQQQQHANPSNVLYGQDGQNCQYTSAAASVLSASDPATVSAVPSTSTTSASNFFGYPTQPQASDFVKVGNYDSWFAGAANSYVHASPVIGSSDAASFGHHASPNVTNTNPYACLANGSNSLAGVGSMNIVQHANASRLSEPKQPLFPWMKYSGKIG